MKRGIGIAVVVGAIVLCAAPAALGKTAPFSYWSVADANKNLIRANPQIGFTVTHHTTIIDASCDGVGKPMLRRKQRVYREFSCTAHFRDDVDGTGSLGGGLSFVTSKTRRGVISCWARSHAGLVSKRCA